MGFSERVEQKFITTQDEIIARGSAVDPGMVMDAVFAIIGDAETDEYDIVSFCRELVNRYELAMEGRYDV